MKRLNALDPRNTEWQRMLALSRYRFGNTLCSTGHVDEARGRYRDSLRLFEALAVHDDEIEVEVDNDVSGDVGTFNYSIQVEKGGTKYWSDPKIINKAGG